MKWYIFCIIAFIVWWNLIKVYVVYLVVKDQKSKKLWERYDIALKKHNEAYDRFIKNVGNK